jgi:TRAP transporter TAXI family solute receptor
MIKTATITYSITLIMVIVVVGSLIVWYFTEPRMPQQPILLTGYKGGQYYKLGQSVQDSIQRRLGNRVQFEVQATAGSQDNFERLTSDAAMVKFGHAHLAIVQGGTVPIEQLTTIAPLYPEFVHVIVRSDSGIDNVAGLVGHHIALGLDGSGDRMMSKKLLDYYDITMDQIKDNKHYFMDLLQENSQLDGAVVTAGFQHPDLIEVLDTQQYRLLPIDFAPAIEMADPFLRRVEIPKGLYAQNPPVPREPVTTLATTAFLVTREDTDSRLIEAALGAIYEDNLRIEFPSLIARSDAPSWISTRLHPEAHDYLHPADNLGFVATVLETVAAVKELLLALAASIFLIWQRWRKAIQREQQQLFFKQKEHLDVLLQKTLEIELSVAKCSDTTKLGQYLQKVTRIKVNVLREFTDEELRDDNTFLIFLRQCDGLINGIQLKVIESQGGTAKGGSTAAK